MTKWAVLSYSTGNIGDDIQSLAALQYLPRVHALINRERLSQVRGAGPYRIVLNGWFAHRRTGWPPSDELQPLLTSMHLAEDWLYASPNIEYLRRRASDRPVGARDIWTRDRLLKAGVPAVHSGCLTLTLALHRAPDPSDEICAVDVPAPLPDAMRVRFGARWRSITHTLTDQPRRIRGWRDRTQLAANLLRRYAACTCVVTGRLHAALPALALGTPVLFVVRKPDRGRYAGLREHLHWVSASDFARGRFDYDIGSPPSNADGFVSTARALRSSVSEFTGAGFVPFDQALAAVIGASGPRPTGAIRRP